MQFIVAMNPSNGAWVVTNEKYLNQWIHLGFTIWMVFPLVMRA